jgi:hypothetical protein
MQRHSDRRKDNQRDEDDNGDTQSSQGRSECVGPMECRRAKPQANVGQSGTGATIVHLGLVVEPR